MAVCECIFSDNSFKHIQIIQKKLQKDHFTPTHSDVVGMLLRYIVFDYDMISLDDFVMVEQYFLDHPVFHYSFYNDVMMSATFDMEPYLEV